MSTTSFDSVFTLGATMIKVPVGATAALLITPFAGQVNCLIKYSSGGTCEILPAGLTQIALNLFAPVAQPGQTLLALSGSGYLLGANEALSIPGPASFYLSSTGATSVLYAIFGKGQGY